MNRDVKKISWDGKRMTVRYEVPRAGGTDEYEMSCVDAPQASLKAALNALIPHVADICELPSVYCADLEVRGVSYSYGGDNRVLGATITALKHVGTANAPLVLNTPHLASEPYAEGGDEDKLLSPEATEHLQTLAAETIKYVDGQREQLMLFAAGVEGDASKD